MEVQSHRTQWAVAIQLVVYVQYGYGIFSWMEKRAPIYDEKVEAVWQGTANAVDTQKQKKDEINNKYLAYTYGKWFYSTIPHT